MSKELLIIFIRNPALGKVKTRLANKIGDEKALEIYKALLKHTMDTTKDLSCDKIVYYSDFIDPADDWDPQIYQKSLQVGDDLGPRMLSAFQEGFERGYESIVIIGSDCLELTPEIIQDSFKVLQDNDVVLGPAKDGGYYLMGMKKLHVSFFFSKEWGTSSVLQETMKNILQKQLSLQLLPVLSDIDDEKDLNSAFSFLKDQN